MDLAEADVFVEALEQVLLRILLELRLEKALLAYLDTDLVELKLFVDSRHRLLLLGHLSHLLSGLVVLPLLQLFVSKSRVPGVHDLVALFAFDSRACRSNIERLGLFINNSLNHRDLLALISTYLRSYLLFLPLLCHVNLRHFLRRASVPDLSGLFLVRTDDGPVLRLLLREDQFLLG